MTDQQTQHITSYLAAIASNLTEINNTLKEIRDAVKAPSSENVNDPSAIVVRETPIETQPDE